MLIVRFVILIAAMEHAILRDPAPRRWLGYVVAASAAYIVIQSLVQFAFGRNLYGEGRGPDGELTGPFGKPRAGPPLVRILFPALMPSVAELLRRPGIWSVAAGYMLLFAGIGVMVLIGQRMPLLLTGLGLVAVALMLRRLRPAMITAAILGVLLLAASPVIAPAAHYRLVSKFSGQMEHFASSRYGELYARALEIGMQHPLTGLGAGVPLWLPAAALFPSKLRRQPEGRRRRDDLLAPSAQLLCRGAGRRRLCRSRTVRLARVRLAGDDGRRCCADRAGAGRVVRCRLDPALADRVDDRLHQHAGRRVVVPAAGLGHGRGALGLGGRPRHRTYIARNRKSELG